MFVTIVTNGRRETLPAARDITPRDFMVKNNVDFSSSQTTLDGTILTPNMMNMTFEELGVKDACYLTAIVKHDNAVK